MRLGRLVHTNKEWWLLQRCDNEECLAALGTRPYLKMGKVGQVGQLCQILRFSASIAIDSLWIRIHRQFEKFDSVSIRKIKLRTQDT